jgi:hypothetical protein
MAVRIGMVMAAVVVVGAIAMLTLCALAYLASHDAAGTPAWVLRALALLAPLFALMIPAVLVTAQPINRDFFGIAAQVIPILLLAAVLEIRVLDRIGRIDSQSMGITVIVVLGIAKGEFEALQGVWGGPAAADTGWIVGAIATGFAFILLNVITPPLPGPKGDEHKGQEEATDGVD